MDQTATQSIHPRMHVHLVGIGGSGLSAIARVLLGRGYTVSGSDQQPNEQTAALNALGATVFTGHAADHIQGADLVLISSAIQTSNPEVQAGEAAGVPVMKRAAFLGQLMAGSHGVGVAGTHGKTTTTGLLGHLLIEAGWDPTLIIGGVLPSLDANGRAGAGPHFVIEADEYDHMFLGLPLQTTIITNIEHDHPDLFATPEDYQAAFVQFARQLPAGGRFVVCLDDAGNQRLLDELELPGVDRIGYGLQEAVDGDVTRHYRAVDLRPNPLGGTDYLLQIDEELVGLARLRIPGEHNVRNALAATAVAMELGVPFNDVQQALISFGGVGRRFQLLGEVANVTVIDDYAHHPTEIRATLTAARQRYPGRRLWAVWQPHTYSRTRLLLNAFASSFTEADRVIALDIYRSREQELSGVDTAAVVAQMEHPYVRHIGDRADAAAYIVDRIRPGDVILTLGAGDGNMVGQWVLDQLKERLGQ